MGEDGSNGRHRFGEERGAGFSRVSGSGAPPPREVLELAEACVRFVERAVGVKLDYEPETLSVLDHYLETARADASQKPEVGAMVAHAAGAYLGEVLRRRHLSWWRVEGDDPTYWRVELEEVFLAVTPVELVADALGRGDDGEEPIDTSESGAGAGIEIEEQEREAVRTRLADLPPVSEQEYFAPSTRLEVIDIAVEAIRARRMAAGEPASAALTPRDYDDD